MNKMKLNIQLFATWGNDYSFDKNLIGQVGYDSVTRTGQQITVKWGSRVKSNWGTFGFGMGGSDYWKLGDSTGGNTSNKYYGKGSGGTYTKGTWYYTKDKNTSTSSAITSARYDYTAKTNVSGYAAGSLTLTTFVWTYDSTEGYARNAKPTVKVSYPAATLTVTYDLNGGQGDSTAQSATYNTAFTTHSAPTKTGYTFNGWLGDDGVVYQADTSYTLTEFLVLTAQWTVNTYPIQLKGWINSTYWGSYSLRDNITGCGTTKISIDGTPLSGRYSVYNTELPYNTSYSFDDIQPEPGYTYMGVYSGSASGVVGISPVEVILQFIVNVYTIVYDTKGGIGSINSQTKVYGQNLTLTTSQPTKDGYDFLGWDTNSAGTTVVYHSGDTLTTDLTTVHGARITLYAVWRETAPSNVRFTTAEVVGPFNISLAWTCTGLNITNYTLEYKVHGTSNYTLFDCGTSTSLPLFPVSEETTYDMRIKATNPGGSTYSDVIELTTPADQAKIRIYNGNAWLQGKTYIYNGSTWVKAKKVYIYDGSTWKINSNN